MAHMEVMALAPESMIHLKAIQGGVVTMKGAIKNPFKVYGAHIIGCRLMAT
jgi:hypothetical protein